ncbi:MAG: hypothetical protein ACOC0R_00130 [Mariniphaga sp.]
MNDSTTSPFRFITRNKQLQVKSLLISGMVACLMLFLSFSCSDKNRQHPDPVELSWDFSPGDEGWNGDFAGYPQGEEALYELLFEHDTLPLPLDQDQHSLKLAGNNHNGDLFMFAKKRITGLDANAVYFVTFNIEFASNLPGDSTTQDSPGKQVYLAAGATPVEPQKVNGENNVYEMNIGTSNLSQNGEQMVVLGNFTNGTSQPDYALNAFENENPFRGVTNDKGELWVIIGIDSAWPAPITAYINRVKVELY